MALVFKQPQQKSDAPKSTKPVTADYFANDIAVFDESTGDAHAKGSTPDGVCVITNYRQHTDGSPGRKSPLMGQRVLDLRGMPQVIPLSEMDFLLENLTRIVAEIKDAGVLAGAGAPVPNDDA